jgi:hypothetical protein
MGVLCLVTWCVAIPSKKLVRQLCAEGFNSGVKELMTYKVEVAVCSEIRTKHSTQSEHHVEFLNVKPGGL